jgi:hypothetical protein
MAAQMLLQRHWTAAKPGLATPSVLQFFDESDGPEAPGPRVTGWNGVMPRRAFRDKPGCVKMAAQMRRPPSSSAQSASANWASSIGPGERLGDPWGTEPRAVPG